MSTLSERRSRRRRWSADEKVAYLEAFRESGLSGSAFCRDTGIPRSTFERWKCEVQPGPQEQQQDETAPAAVTPSAFARVALVPSLPTLGTSHASPMRLVVRGPTGHEATLDGVDERTAVQVLALVLGGPR
jgi:transposase-like protein